MQMDLRNQYLESKVLTAPAHRLHLMLIEGAIRFGRQAEELLRRNETLAAEDSFMRMMAIVGELLVGVRQGTSEINDKLIDLYGYMFRTLAFAKVNGDADQLAEILHLLEFERETWRLVCDKFAGETADPKPNAKGGAHFAPSRMPVVAKSLSTSAPNMLSSGISLEA
jgi:flagellar secretion chaperone FliS